VPLAAAPPFSGPIGLHFAHVVVSGDEERGDEERGDVPAKPGRPSTPIRPIAHLKLSSSASMSVSPSGDVGKDSMLRPDRRYVPAAATGRRRRRPNPLRQPGRE
jgi:hypothetical protein